MEEKDQQGWCSLKWEKHQPEYNDRINYEDSRTLNNAGSSRQVNTDGALTVNWIEKGLHCLKSKYQCHYWNNECTHVNTKQ